MWNNFWKLFCPTAFSHLEQHFIFSPHFAWIFFYLEGSEKVFLNPENPEVFQLASAHKVVFLVPEA